MIPEIASSSPSFWQSPLWEALLLDSGQAKDVIILGYGVEAIMVEFRPIGIGMIGAFSLGVDKSLYTESFINRCRGEIYDRGAIFWQIEEYHPRGIPLDSPEDNTYGRHFLEPWTRVIDLSQDEEDIMASMHEKGRYNIRVAWKRGVSTKWVDPTVENIDIWMHLLAETTARDSFAENSREYYISFLQNLRESNTGGLLFAFYEEKVIAAGIFVYYHNVAIYYYGASTSDPEMRKHMAPYLIQWEAIREGKIRGCSIYDFLGIAPVTDEYHALRGVTNFKEKFGGSIIRVGVKELFVLKILHYRIFTLVRAVRNTYLAIKKRIRS